MDGSFYLKGNFESLKAKTKIWKKKKSCAYLLDSYSLFSNGGHGFKTELTLDLIYFFKVEKKLLPAKLQILFLYHQRCFPEAEPTFKNLLLGPRLGPVPLLWLAALRTPNGGNIRQLLLHRDHARPSGKGLLHAGLNLLFLQVSCFIHLAPM